MGIDGNRKPAGISIISINGAVGFPYAIGMPGGVTGISNEENSCPKVLLQLVLSFDGRQVIARGNDAAIKDHKVILAGIKDYVLATGTDTITGEGNQNINCHMAADASFHGMGRNCC